MWGMYRFVAGAAVVAGVLGVDALAGPADIEGRVAYRIDGDLIAVEIERIVNNTIDTTTGTLYIEVWMTEGSNPVGSGHLAAQHRITGSSNGTLGPGQYFSDIRLALDYRPPTGGARYVHFLTTQYPEPDTLLGWRTLMVRDGGSSDDHGDPRSGRRRGDTVAGRTNGLGFRCSMFGDFSFQGVPRRGQPDYRVERMIEDIVAASGLKKNFMVVSSPDVPNAAAWLEGDRRMIGYNPNFLNDVVGRTGSEWAVKSIMAHEVGHHLQGHTLQPGGSRPPTELEADNYSGHIVRWLGGTLDHALVAMNTIAPDQGSATHPGRWDRLNAIREGWNQAGIRTGASTSQPSTSPLPFPAPTQPRPSRFPVPTVPAQTATACCKIVAEVLAIPICPMDAGSALPVGASCACYNVIGQPFFDGVVCGVATN